MRTGRRSNFESYVQIERRDQALWCSQLGSAFRTGSSGNEVFLADNQRQMAFGNPKDMRRIQVLSQICIVLLVNETRVNVEGKEGVLSEGDGIMGDLPKHLVSRCSQHRTGLACCC